MTIATKSMFIHVYEKDYYGTFNFLSRKNLEMKL